MGFLMASGHVIARLCKSHSQYGSSALHRSSGFCIADSLVLDKRGLRERACNSFTKTRLAAWLSFLSGSDKRGPTARARNSLASTLLVRGAIFSFRRRARRMLLEVLIVHACNP